MAVLPEINGDQRLFLQTIFDFFHARGKWHLCKLFDSMAANFDNYVTEWQQCVSVSATTGRASQANPKPLTLGRYIVICVK